MKIEDIMDDFLTNGEGSENDGDYKFEVGDYVLVKQTGHQEMAEHWKRMGIEGNTYKGFIRSRRNAYPGMGFYPIYYIVGLGEIFEGGIKKIA